MNPVVMALLLVVGWGAFFYSASKRWKLMTIAAPANRFDRIPQRIRDTFIFAIGQARMPRHPLAGVAHIFIYAGAVIMLLRGLILFVRGFIADPHFGLWLFDHGTPLGNLYSLTKDLFIVLVMLGIIAFFYFRVIGRLKRMNLNFEGILILCILTTLMLSDVLYDAASIARHNTPATIWEPLGSLLASPIRSASPATINALCHLGFWIHVTTILAFLNYLPYCKQFHEITAFPNVFFRNLDPPGKLETTRDLEGKVEREETLGIAHIQQFSWKAFLDFYSCTECGRCTDQCPAANTGKRLSPKDLTTSLRDHLYSRQSELIAKQNQSQQSQSDKNQSTNDQAANDQAANRIDLVGPDATIDPETIWACTTCRACETECPLFISYVDKIVDLRRHLVQEKGDFPQQLATAFRGLENSGNPWNLPPRQRTEWMDGLDVPTMADKQSAEYLLWIGCAPAYDDKAIKTARATVQLLNMAGIDYAVLGQEEQCNGDPARRAGNEFLFQIMAQANIEILNAYNVKEIITICPHCYNTLQHEYPDLDGHYQVTPHTDFLAQLIDQGKLTPTEPVDATVTFHDSCYLGRYNDIYQSPRKILANIPGLRLIEPTQHHDRAMCCGAGGAQFFKEEETGHERVNYARADQLIETNAATITTACPFCKSMLSDGLAARDQDDHINLQDIAELLLQSLTPKPPPD